MTGKMIPMIGKFEVHALGFLRIYMWMHYKCANNRTQAQFSTYNLPRKQAEIGSTDIILL
ncbi:hypothetical protein ACJX0J_023402, partial [Zea mays]